jgi:hypothetical protein
MTHRLIIPCKDFRLPLQDRLRPCANNVQKGSQKGVKRPTLMPKLPSGLKPKMKMVAFYTHKATLLAAIAPTTCALSP